MTPEADATAVDLEPAPLGPLYAALTKVCGELQKLPKEGYNAEHRYHFVRDEDVAEAVRGACSKHGMVILPSVLEHRATLVEPPGGKKPYWSHTVDVAFHLAVAGEECRTVLSWPGQAHDWGDKGLAKALTAARKTFYVALFQISAGDDPERAGAGDGAGAPSEADQLKLALEEVQRRALAAEVVDVSSGEVNEHLLDAIVKWRTAGKVKRWKDLTLEFVGKVYGGLDAYKRDPFKTSDLLVTGGFYKLPTPAPAEAPPAPAPAAESGTLDDLARSEAELAELTERVKKAVGALPVDVRSRLHEFCDYLEVAWKFREIAKQWGERATDPATLVGDLEAEIGARVQHAGA